MDALPADVRTELVMGAAALDGQSVSTHRFRSGDPPELLHASIRERWRAGGVPVIDARHGEWWLVSMRDADGFTTVQVRAAGTGSEGLVTRWRGATASDGPPAQVPPPSRWLPVDARVLRQLVHRDPGRDAATVVALVPRTPDAASRALRRGAARDGYVDDPALGGPAGRAAWYRGRPGAGEALAFRRGREEVVATVSDHPGGAAVVMHWGIAR